MTNGDDPVDRARTFRARAGEEVKDLKEAVGLALIAVAAVLVAACLAAAALASTAWTIGLAVAGFIAAVAGSVLFAVERRRVGRLRGGPRRRGSTRCPTDV